ncbi:hypothetical protein WJX79_007652 [Trebouxia sp. C0005]
MHGLAGIRSTSAGVNTRCRFVNKFSVSAVWGPQPLCYGSVRRGAIVGASHGESSRQETSAKPYTNRLQTNPAYQRLKARKQQPQEAGPPSSDDQGAETSSNKQTGSGSMAKSPRPSPEFGQRLKVVGSHTNLGSWIMVDGPELRWTEGDRWHAKITLPSGSVYEYKYVLLDSSGTHALTWQRGNNSVLAIQKDEPELEVFDNWEGQPGAAVMAGGKSSTRESKLLAWATDIEAQLGLQRQELRRSRIELASAQEDARRARQEARAVRMELAQSQSVRAQADRLIRELQSSNRLLKSELQATTTTFKQALHAAQTMLDTAEEREQDIPGKLEQQAESEEAIDAMPGKPAAGTPDLAGNAVSKFSEESSAPVKRGVKGPADTVTNSGIQGQVAESTTSSNARQQSTSSVASPGPASASKPTTTIGKAASNTQAGPKPSSSQDSIDSNSSDASISMASASKAGPLSSTLPSPAAAKADFASQPQMADLPKHGKPEVDNAAAAPPKAPGTFPVSEASISPHQASPEGQSAAASQAPAVHSRQLNPDMPGSGDLELATADQAVSETTISDKNTAGGKESLAAAPSNGVSAESASSRSRSARTKKSTPMSSS